MVGKGWDNVSVIVHSQEWGDVSVIVHSQILLPLTSELLLPNPPFPNRNYSHRACSLKSHLRPSAISTHATCLSTTHARTLNVYMGVRETSTWVGKMYMVYGTQSTCCILSRESEGSSATPEDSGLALEGRGVPICMGWSIVCGTAGTRFSDRLSNWLGNAGICQKSCSPGAIAMMNRNKNQKVNT